MGSMSWIHWVLVAAVAAIAFGGRGKLSGLMGDAGKGIRAFKDGLSDDKRTSSGSESVGSDERCAESRPSDISERASARTNLA